MIICEVETVESMLYIDENKRKIYSLNLYICIELVSILGYFCAADTVDGASYL